MWVSSFRHSWCFTPVYCMQHSRAYVWVFWEKVEREKWYILSRYHCSLASDCMFWQAQGRPAFLGRLRTGGKSSLDCSLQERNPKTSAFWPHCGLQLGLGNTYTSMESCTLPVWRVIECMDPNPSLVDTSHNLKAFVTGLKLDDVKIDCSTQT